MAHIVINALSLRPGGGLQVIAGLLARFSPQNSYTVLWSDPASLASFRAIVGKREHVSYHSPVSRTGNVHVFLWQMTKLSACLKRLRADVVLNVNHHFPSSDVFQIVYHLNVLRFDRSRGRFWQVGEAADRLRDWRAGLAMKDADANVFESHYLRGLAERKAGPARHASVIYIGLDDRTAKPPIKTAGQPSSMLIAVTSPQPHKDNPVLVEMLAVLVTRRPLANWHLKIAGGRTPHAFSELKADAARRGVGNRISWLGFLPHEALRLEAAECLCLVSTSRVESFCMVALEAMRWGLPAIVADSTAMPESVGEAGLLARPGDAQSFASHVLQLFDDPAEHARLRELGRSRSAEMTWSAAAQAFERIFP